MQEGTAVGFALGELGLIVGASVGDEGAMDGDLLGLHVRLALGFDDGKIDGITLGLLGCTEGACVGVYGKKVMRTNPSPPGEGRLLPAFTSPELPTPTPSI